MADYDIAAAFDAIEQELISSMVRNFKRHRAEERDMGFDWPQWQAEQLDALETYRRRNSRKFSPRFRALNGLIEAAIRTAYADGGADQEKEILRAVQRGASALRGAGSADAAFSRTNERKLNALVDATLHDMKRAETAILRRANDTYRKAIFNAQVYANTGAGTYEKAVDMATRDMAANGLRCVVYQNGAQHTLRDYADMALRTASKRAYLAGEGAKRQEWGVTTVIINKRGNACPRCARFAGHIFIDDVWSGGRRGDGRYPLLSSAIAQGLYHPRCKDSHTTYFPELSDTPEPYTDDEIRELERQEQAEEYQKYAQRQSRRFARLADYSLDEENRRRYQVREQQWQTIAEQGKPDPERRQTLIAPVVKTAEYRRRLDRFGESVDVARVIWQNAVAMLKHRSGTTLEDMAYIDSLTGKALTRTDYHKPHECLPTKRMRQMLRESKPETIIVIHNHPQSGVPSYADLRAAQAGRYKYGVIVGHNGIVFRYHVAEDAKLEMANFHLDILQKRLYNRDETKIQQALAQLQSCGVELEVFR